MILYNVTTKVENSIHEEWLKWIQEVHIPDVMKTGMFIENKLCRMLTSKQPDGVTYAVQYLCKDMKTMHQYESQFSKPLREAYKEKYEGKYVVFRSVMEVIATHEAKPVE